MFWNILVKLVLIPSNAQLENLEPPQWNLGGGEAYLSLSSSRHESLLPKSLSLLCILLPSAPFLYLIQLNDTPILPSPSMGSGLYGKLGPEMGGKHRPFRQTASLPLNIGDSSSPCLWTMSTNLLFFLAPASNFIDGQLFSFKLPSLVTVKPKESCPYLIQSSLLIYLPPNSPWPFSKDYLPNKMVHQDNSLNKMVLRGRIWGPSQEG